MNTMKASNGIQNQKTANKATTGKVSDVRKMTMTAMLAAVATVLMFLSVSVPFMPSYIKFDISELPALIASFTLGPVSGVTVCLVKNLINVFQSTTSGVGELCNFLMGVTFVLPAGLLYNRRRTFKGAVLGVIIGCFSMAILSVPLNYFVVYPAYIKLAGYPLEGIIAMYNVLNSYVDTLLKGLIIFNMPFTFLKGLSSVLITFLIYKPLSPIIRGER